MHSKRVRNTIKQSVSLQTRYDTTHINDRFYMRTHVYVFRFSVKKRVFELSRVWPWRWPRGGTPYMVLIGPVFHTTFKTWKKYVSVCKRTLKDCLTAFTTILCSLPRQCFEWDVRYLRGLGKQRCNYQRLHPKNRCYWGMCKALNVVLPNSHKIGERPDAVFSDRALNNAHKEKQACMAKDTINKYEKKIKYSH